MAKKDTIALAKLKAVENLGTMEDFFDVLTHPGGNHCVQFGTGDDEVRIEAGITQHPVPTSALRIWYRGRQLAYSCDTSFDKGLWHWLWDGPDSHSAHADLVIHEVGHGIHTSYDDLVSYTERRSVALTNKLRLIHYPDDLLPMLEASEFGLMREGKLEIV